MSIATDIYVWSFLPDDFVLYCFNVLVEQLSSCIAEHMLQIAARPPSYMTHNVLSTHTAETVIKMYTNIQSLTCSALEFLNYIKMFDHSKMCFTIPIHNFKWLKIT